MQDNIITLTGNVPKNTSGFVAYTVNDIVLGDYSEYTTIYRVLPDAVQFSNDGSVWVPPKKDVLITVGWNDGDDVKGIRPAEIAIDILLNGEKDKSIKLNSSMGWQYELTNVLESDEYTINVEDITDYSYSINGTSVVYTTEYPQPEVLTVDDVAIAVAELTDVVVQNSTDIVDTQTALAEVYEMITQ
ncbi:MAG: Cna B-type domain-containing protein [Clostridiales bacterium]|nr:Cna B-type domain-containing protein [Clostridiales bacterium]